jgi:flagellum-specific peptidoglycan hydrolase FlgJ
MTKSEFIHKMNTACNEAAIKNVRFNKAEAVVYAQAALESNWGNSELTQKANNLFSIKAGTSWTEETIELPGLEWHYRYGWYHSLDKWRKYPSWTDCIIDYARIIAEVSWFQDALQYLEDPKQFLKALLPDGTHPGWATDPNYYQKVTQIAFELESYGGPKWTV